MRILVFLMCQVKKIQQFTQKYFFFNIYKIHIIFTNIFYDTFSVSAFFLYISISIYF